MTRKRHKKNPTIDQWYQMDLHLHTPASADFQQEGVTYLDLLREAERKGVSIIAFTDHNTVSGHKAIAEEIDDLELLERLGRLAPEEEQRLQEYRRLLDKILVLRGFEFTATFGFHILGIFSPKTNLRDLEFLLLQLGLPPDKLDCGATDVGATTDVLTAYQLIHEAGGIVIGAHANSNHGVALQGIRFGGQTRIAFTQDEHLHALEVTDLDRQSKNATARFFDGSKPEYPRRMRCIQGSDSHRLTRDPHNPKNLGVGDRVTEVLLPELSFEALAAVFNGDDFACTRPYRAEARPFDYIQAAREEGPNIVQDFHQQYSKRGGFLDAIVADVCAFANTNGGVLYIGVPEDPRKPPTGLGNAPTRVLNMLRTEIETRLTPALAFTVDLQDTLGVKVARITVPRGNDAPYTVDDSKIYLRSEAETTLAVRDEIVAMVKRSLGLTEQPPAAPAPAPVATAPLPPETAELLQLQPAETPELLSPPRTGVEIADVEIRQGTRYYTMRDLRNGNLVKNVTLRSARHLWRYAIQEAENNPVNPAQVRWLGDVGMWKRRAHGNLTRFDLVQRVGDTLRIYYGVTEEGLHGLWSTLVGE
ncbi:MAG TPA: putative DNA binding domain-containing protein [Anaerolineae bacterium]|mgnify:FL=1|nr:putative DNA binding domain-containing protein [Anaerolineae bacterium]HQM15399.1 putative DNA binding domain-containing protein [Anaerolineae bacterium]